MLALLACVGPGRRRAAAAAHAGHRRAKGSGLPPTLTITLAADETLLVTTDGVTEARNADGEFYALPEEAARAATSDPALLVAHVRDGVLRHSRGRLSDDTTIFAIRRTRTPG
ncbi:SpoIIE family protein phosphatase [Streptomyces sp. NPDC054804]